MTRDDAAASRRHGFRDAKCYIWEEDKGFWATDNNGYTPDRARAQLNTIKYLIGLSGNFLAYIQPAVGISQPPVPVDGQPKRRCHYMQLVDSTLVAMLQAAPLNETFRARLMSKVGQMPPAEADTWDKLKDWVEFNFPKGGDKKVTNNLEPLRIRASCSEREHGKCRYSRTMSGKGEVMLDAKHLIDLAHEYDVLDSLMDAVLDEMRDACENQIEMDADDEETAHHDRDDSDGMNLDFSMIEFKQKLYAILKANLDEEKLEELGL